MFYNFPNNNISNKNIRNKKIVTFFLSQAYVFSKVSQNQLLNRYHLKFGLSITTSIFFLGIYPRIIVGHTRILDSKPRQSWWWICAPPKQKKKKTDAHIVGHAASCKDKRQHMITLRPIFLTIVSLMCGSCKKDAMPSEFPPVTFLALRGTACTCSIPR